MRGRPTDLGVLPELPRSRAQLRGGNPMMKKIPPIRLAMFLGALCLIAPIALEAQSPRSHAREFNPTRGMRQEEPLNAYDLPEYQAKRLKEPEPEKRPSVRTGPAAPKTNIEGFDLSLLRSSSRVSSWRYLLKGVKSIAHGKSGPEEESIGKRSIFTDIVLEFGRPAGMAEASDREVRLRATIRDLIGKFSSDDLLTTQGKIEFKERIVSEVNAIFKTAKVRQVYLTDFRLLRV